MTEYGDFYNDWHSKLDIDLENYGLYVLTADKRPVVPQSLAHWTAMMDNENRRTVATHEFGNYKVITFFTGANRHYYSTNRTLALFETRVILSMPEGWGILGASRWPTWEAAENGHRRVTAVWKSYYRKQLRARKKLDRNA